MTDISLGTKLFSRTERLQRLLESIPAESISTVYVAHDGEWDDEKRNVLDADYPFELSILDLEYDAGVGVGKNRIVDACDTDYLLMVDTDHCIPNDIETLHEQLEARPHLGGIAGNVVEPNNDRLWQSAKNLREEGGGLVRDASHGGSVEIVADDPLVEFDFVPSAILLRTACLDDYWWDEQYIVGSEHLDFHVGHWKQTDWSFAINPSVAFEHYPGGSQSYLTNRHGENVRKGREYFRNKWGYEFVRDEQAYWFDTSTLSFTTGVRRAVSRSLPTSVYKQAKNVYDTLGHLRHR